MSKYEEQFPIVKSMSSIKWNSRDPHIAIIPPRPDGWGGARYYDLNDYDGFVNKFDDGTYHYAKVGLSFHAQLVPIGFDGGRSAANIRFRDIHRGYSYLMTADKAIKLIGEAMENAKTWVEGEFSLTKRGSNYRLAEV